MKARKIFGISAILVAVLAVAVGLCCFFLTNKPVRDVPQSVEVQVVDGEYFLTTQFDGRYSYQFRLEQKFGEEKVLIDTISSDVNNINLSKCNISTAPGSEYLFSACYVFENQKGEFSKPLEWKF